MKQPQARTIAAFLQSASLSKQVPGMRGSTMFDEHQDSTGEALSIVAQVKDLGSTFQDDKQSSIDQETELNSAFQNLMAQKGQQLASLTTQRNTQQAILNKVSQELSENENAASLFLRQQSGAIHSELLATAAMATGSGEALAPVVQQLNELVVRLDDQQKQEEEHKEWCEKELSETAKTKSHHEMLVEELKGKIEDTKGLIEDKKQSISDTADAIKTADEEYAELKDVRAKAKADFEAEHADYVDAIQALNQAIDLLADFYRSGSLIQSAQSSDQVYVPDAADRAGAPSMGISGSYEKKVGARVVSILSDTRKEFAAGKESLEKQEAQQVADFEASTVAYQKTRADLVDAGNRLSAELQP